MKAVVCHELNKISVEDVTIDPPKAGEVGIKMSATGVCHSDLSVINGTIPAMLPCVLGHEGAGVIETVGEGVTNVVPGDHVIMSFVPNCGECFHCLRGQAFLCTALPPTGRQLDGTTRLHLGDQDLGAMTALGNMAEQVVCPAMNVVKIDPEVPLKTASLVGCGVATGVGAAINTAKVEPGSNVAVFGCGGVGLSIIQGARIAGADRIIAVDLAANKLEMATRFGATDTVDASDGDPVAKIMEITGGVGADYAFEAIGVPAVVQQAYTATRRGGSTVVVGVGKVVEQISFNALMMSLEGKTVYGCMYGSVNPKVDFPKLLGLSASGKLDLDGMVTNTYTIDEAPQAFEDLEKGINARGVIVFD
ncbi:MAG: Zn-dependent alcohol dehydrogenase [Deltaproteobacteria bacterium]|nr:Zn-dependent alcohol dehydrogenase [Deltaproteobacteria bacterium]MBW2413168.1 Zn-dependent alcohol dehydrogenase [Deltaproteobacteria bacterium]